MLALVVGYCERLSDRVRVATILRMRPVDVGCLTRPEEHFYAKRFFRRLKVVRPPPRPRVISWSTRRLRTDDTPILLT